MAVPLVAGTRLTLPPPTASEPRLTRQDKAWQPVPPTPRKLWPGRVRAFLYISA